MTDAGGANRPRLLVVDDEKSLREFLVITLEREGYEVVTAESGDQAIRLLEDEQFDAALVDLRMRGADGLQVLRQAKLRDAGMVVILMTAYATAETAVEAMREGALDYLIKPFKVDELRVRLGRGLERRMLALENQRLRHEIETRYRFETMVGKSRPMQDLFDVMRRVAESRATVLITGERGTGKELVARAIHFNSPRKAGPFVPVNCSAIPHELMESELFGHVKGAFTGAVANREGVFELAHGGTLFLDEVAEISSTVQAKLLRVLQEREFRRVGATRETRVDVRIIAATNRNLTEAVAKGAFRDDLFDRLNVVQLHVPPLRDRRADIPLLVYHFLQRFASEMQRPAPPIAPEALALLEAYGWPGNVRELENVIERAMTLAPSDRIEVTDLPEQVRQPPRGGATALIDLPAEGMTIDTVMASIERSLVEQALRRTGGVQKRAAELLGCSFRSIRYLIAKHGIDKDGAAAASP